MKAGGSISIWFFIGVSLLFNGVLILAAGIYQYLQPPETPTVLFNLHAGVWWGARQRGRVDARHLPPVASCAAQCADSVLAELKAGAMR